MRKFIQWGDDKRELTPLTFAEFDKYDHWTGGNDVAWIQFLRANRFYDLEDFDEEAIREGKMVLEEGEPQIDWSLQYGWLEYVDGQWINSPEGTDE